jgi:hypothetical protein
MTVRECPQRMLQCQDGGRIDDTYYRSQIVINIAPHFPGVSFGRVDRFFTAWIPNRHRESFCRAIRHLRAKQT